MESKTSKREKPRILFIENQPHHMSIYLTPLIDDYDVIVADDLITAVEYLEENVIHLIDLVILDIMMPPLEMFSLAETNDGLLSGVRFFENYLYRKPENKPVKVIILTGATGKTYQTIKELYSTSEQIKELMHKDVTKSNDLKSVVDKILLNN